MAMPITRLLDILFNLCSKDYISYKEMIHHLFRDIADVYKEKQPGCTDAGEPNSDSDIDDC